MKKILVILALALMPVAAQAVPTPTQSQTFGDGSILDADDLNGMETQWINYIVNNFLNGANDFTIIAGDSMFVNGKAIVDSLRLTGYMDITGTWRITGIGDFTAIDSLTVTGKIIADSLNASGYTRLDTVDIVSADSITVTGQVITDSLSASGYTRLDTVDITSADSITATGVIITDSLTATGAVAFDSLDVSGEGVFDSLRTVGVTRLAPDSLTLTIPDTTITALSGSVIQTYRLSDVIVPTDTWNVDAFQAAWRTNGAYDGKPWPDLFHCLITDGGDSLGVVDATTGRQVIWFTGGIYVGDGAAVEFLDGIIYCGQTAGRGIKIFDFVADKITFYQTAGYYKNNGGIADRGTAATILLNSAPAIVGASIEDVAVIADPHGRRSNDGTGRLAHWWWVAAGSDGSIYDPIDHAIYDTGVGWSQQKITLAPDGWGLLTASAWTYVVEPIQMISADNWGTPNNVFSYRDQSRSAGSLANSTNEVVSALLPSGIGKFAVLSGGSDGGLLVSHVGSWKTGEHFTSSELTRGAMQLTHFVDGGGTRPALTTTDAAADTVTGVGFAMEEGSGNLNDVHGLASLTTAGSPTYSASGVYGKAVQGNGTNAEFTRTGDSRFNLGTADFSVGIWAENTGGAAWVWRLVVAGSDIIDLRFNSSGYPIFRISDDNGATNDAITYSVDLTGSGKWHYYVCQREGSSIFLYVDGVMVGTTAVSNAAASLDPTDVYLLSSNGADWFTGRVDHFVFNKGRALTLAEIKAQYQDGLDHLSQAQAIDPNDALHAHDVDYLDVDPPWVLAGNQDSLTVFRWNGYSLTPIYRTGDAGGDIADAQVIAMQDTFGVAYVTAGELVQTVPDPRVAPTVVDYGNAARSGRVGGGLGAWVYDSLSFIWPYDAVVDSSGQVPGAYYNLQDADDAVPDGSTIYVRKGTYPAVTINTNYLRVVGSAPKLTTTTGGVMFNGLVDVQGSTVILQNIGFYTEAGGGGGGANALEMNGGRTFVSNCIFLGSDNKGILAGSGNCFITDSDMLGTYDGHVISAETNDLRVSNCRLGGTYNGGVNITTAGVRGVYTGNSFIGTASTDFMQIQGNTNTITGNYFHTGNSGYVLDITTTGDNTLAVGNTMAAAGVNVLIDADAENCNVSYNLINGTITDNSGTSTVDGNEIF